MICNKCQTANPDGAKFCMGCGAALALARPECKTELPVGAQFCFNCGHRMDESPQPSTTPEPVEPKLEQYVPQGLRTKLETARESGGMQGERRVVTMLFCDVKGSTAAAEKLDPEEWAEIMNGAFELLIAPVYHYEGTLARLLGDAILAFFGAPIGHEDDPQRAVLASLEILEAIKPFKEEMQRRWGLDFDVRLGINTGLVVVGEVGSDLKVEYTALGDAVNLAARMEQTAEPGTVQITENTHKLIAPLFDFEDLGEAEVKGKADPVRSYRVLGRKAEPGSLRGIEGLDSRLIGRDNELLVLRNAVDELRQGRGQIVSLMADAGLGKSRLMAEFRKGLVADGLVPATMPELGGLLDAKPELLWHEGRSLSYQTATPYAPFIDLLSTCFGLSAEQTDAENYGKLKGQIATLLPDKAEETTPFIATVLGISLDGDALERVKYLQPPQVRDGAFRALQSLFERLSVVSPMVLVLDDLHWADSTSLDLLEQLMALTDSSMLMIVGMFRPQRQEPSWRFHEVASRDFEHRYTPVSLEPLDEAGSRELVSSILHIEGLPDKVRDMILQKAEGNPFFVEEVIRSLLESAVVVPDGPYRRATRDIDNIAVPDTLSGVLTTRLDRLEEDSKQVAQSAAVIGREFQFDTLSAVVDGLADIEEPLRDLQRRGLIREKSRVPQRVYTFKHTLTQETAYGSLLLSSRRQLHLRVAEQLEQTEPDRVNDIGWHFLEGREHNRALPYLLAAGEQAAHAYATPEAIWYFKRSLDVVDDANDVSLARRAYEGLGGALTFSFDVGGATENYDHMVAYAKAHNDVPMEVSALNKKGFVKALMQGSVEEGDQLLVESAKLAEEVGDDAGLAELHTTYCYIRTAVGDLEEAMNHQKESIRLGSRLDSPEFKLFGMTHISNTLTYLTRFDEAWERTQEALHEAEQVGDRGYIAEAKVLPIAFHYMREGDLQAAHDSAEEGYNLATQIGAADRQADGAFMLGQIDWMRGDYQQAVEWQQRALDAGRMAGWPDGRIRLPPGLRFVCYGYCIPGHQ